MNSQMPTVYFAQMQNEKKNKSTTTIKFTCDVHERKIIITTLQKEKTKSMNKKCVSFSSKMYLSINTQKQTFISGPQID